MATLSELKALIKKIEAKWDSGSVSDLREIVKLDRQVKQAEEKD